MTGYSRPFTPAPAPARRVNHGEGWFRLVVVALVVAAVAFVATSWLQGDFSALDGNTGWANRNHTGITPAGYPQESYPATWRQRPDLQPRSMPVPEGRGYQRCFYNGQHLQCEGGRR